MKEMEPEPQSGLLANPNTTDAIADKEQEQVELISEQTQHFLQTVIDYIPLAVFVKNAQAKHFGELLLWNKTSAEIFGVTTEAIIGKTIYDFFPKSQADFFAQKDREALETRIPNNTPEELIDSHTLGTRSLRTIKVPLGSVLNLWNE